MKRNKHLFAHLHKRFIGQVSMRKTESRSLTSNYPIKSF